MIIRDSNYITILAPMITKLNLKGNELLVFALIHGFSQDGESRFRGSIKYLTQWTGLDRTTIISILKKLTEKQLIVKYEFDKNKVRYCEYTSNYFDILERSENPTTPRSENPTTPRSENPTPVVGKSDPIVITNITNSFDSDITGGEIPGKLFEGSDNNFESSKENTPPQPPPADKEKKTLFRNSEVYKLVKFENGVGVDYSEFEKLFSTPEFSPVDLIYYFHSVSDWSDQKNMKRTKNGWIATVRNFIRGDVEKKKLHLKPEHQTPQNKINVAGAMAYLKDFD